ncbi:MAG: FixH family protein [Granulosicoccaceae bacterium]
MSTSLHDASVNQAGLPWYRYPTVLLIVAIPTVAVIVGFAMLAISFATFDGVVVDDYYKHGKGINQVLHRDETARTLGVVAEVSFNELSVTADLKADDTIAWPESLSLRILHPTQAGRDIVVDMSREMGQRYTADQVVFKPGEWILQIETTQWRLSNRVSIGKNSVLKLK